MTKVCLKSKNTKIVICIVLMALVLTNLTIFNVNAQELNKGLDLFVAPNGNDMAEGTMQNPLKTFEGARNKIRNIKSTSGLPQGGINVNIRAGEYKNTNESFSLNSNDSGTADSPITYKAYNNEDVKIKGDLVLDGGEFTNVSEQAILNRLSQSAKDNVLVYDIKTNNGITDFGQIVKNGFNWPDKTPGVAVTVDGEAQQLSRYPNNGFMNINKVNSRGFYPRGHAPNPDGTCPQCSKEEGKRIPCKIGEENWVNQQGGVFTVYSNELKSKYNLWKLEKDIWVSGYFCWAYADDNCGIEKVESTYNGMKFTAKQPSFYGVGGGDAKKFYAYNLLCEIDEPGEWYLDRETGKLYIYPKKDISNSNVQLSVMNKPFIDMNNCDYIEFEGLNISNGNSHGIQMVGCNNILVAGCNFSDLGQRAVVVGTISNSFENFNTGANGGTNNIIKSCNVKRTGQGGVYLGGGNRYTLTHGNNKVENCDFEDFSVIKRTYSPAVAVVGCGNSVLRNKMYNAPHMAISYEGNDIQIKGNEIFNVCYETSDVGAIYTCRKWSYYGVEISNNYIHNLLTSHGTGSAAVYIDDMASGATIKNNLFVNIPGYTTLFGGGRDITCENNIILNNNNGNGIHYDNRAMGWAKAHATSPDGTNYGELMNLRNNKDYDKAKWNQKYPRLAVIPLNHNGYCNQAAIPAGASIQKNIFVGCPNAVRNICYDVKNNGIVANNNIYGVGTDIGFNNPQAFDYSVKENSKIKLLMGDEHFDVSQMGIYNDEYRKISGTLIENPTLVSPSNNSKDVSFSNGVSLKWNEVDNAGSYIVEIATDNEFSDLICKEATNELSYLQTNLNKSTKYFWRVTALENKINGQKVTSDVYNFTTSSNSEASLFEGFSDSDFTGWTREKGTPTNTTKKAHSGKYSYECNEGMDLISKVLPNYHKDIVTIWMYDNMQMEPGTAAQTSVATKGNWCSLAIRTGFSGDNEIAKYYHMRTTNNFVKTDILRSEGWHELKWDYSSGTNCKMYIDNQLVNTIQTTTGYNYICIGDAWGDPSYSGNISHGLFDDLCIGEPIIEANIISIEMDKQNASVSLGDQLKLNAIVNVTPDIDVELEWKSTENEIARVDENGLVTPNRIGKTKIIVQAKNNPSITAECELIVI